MSIATLDRGGLSVAIRATGPAEVALQAWPRGHRGAVQQTGWVATNAADVAKLSLPAAGRAGHAWAWRGVFRDPASPLRTPIEDVVRTIGARPRRGQPSAFAFAFGCCTIAGLGPSFRSLLRADPAFFALIGDLGYPDHASGWSPVRQTYRGYLKAFDRILSHDLLRPILGSMPLFAVQDDHDYGRDDCDRTTVQPFAGHAFADLIPGAVYPGRNYRSWSIGEVDFFLTDNRRWKDPEEGPYENGRYMSVLGSRQRAWLKHRLARSSARLKCVFIPMTMAFYWTVAETQELVRFIDENVSGTVVFLSGDKHAGAFARYSPRVWELLAAPLSNPTKHRTPDRSSAVIWTENGTGPALYNAYGLVDVDTLSAQTCTLRLMREDGVEMHRHVIPFTG